MASSFGCQSMIAPLRRVVVKRPREAFRSREDIERDWKALGYVRAPNLDRASEEHQRLIRLLEGAGVEVLCLPQDARTGMDSIYTHDPVIITDAGAVILQMGKLARQGEGPAFADALRYWDVPILGTLEGDATAEGGDLLWLDRDTLLAGRSFRTNSAGIEALRAILGPIGVEVVEVHLPAFRGPEEILHLQSLISLLDERLAVVYRPLLPVPVIEALAERKFELVEVPEKELASQGSNVLAIRPRSALMLRGSPLTKARIEAAGCAVTIIDGDEIAFPGSGGPTCLTRPLLRG